MNPVDGNGSRVRCGLAILAELESWLARREDPVAAMKQLVNEMEAELAETQVRLARALADLPPGRPEPEEMLTLRRQVRELTAGVDVACRRHDLLAARAQRAQAALRIPELISGRGAEADRLFREAEERVTAREVRAAAARDLGLAALARVFAPDDRDAEYARELSELRRRFPPAQSESAPA